MTKEERLQLGRILAAKHEYISVIYSEEDEDGNVGTIPSRENMRIYNVKDVIGKVPGAEKCDKNDIVIVTVNNFDDYKEYYLSSDPSFDTLVQLFDDFPECYEFESRKLINK